MFGESEMNIVDKIVRGDVYRKTRLHDEQGNFADAACFTSLPKSIWTYLMFKLTGRAPELPWISYNAIERIDRVLSADANVLEFGSGSSTMWFARRCGFLHSIEHDEVWHRRISSLLERDGLTNVRYDLKTRQDYTDLGEYEAPFFDFCLVDGVERLRSVERAIPMIKSGGFIFLDNSDHIDVEGERPMAVKPIVAAAEKAGGTVDYFTDFAPTQLHANQGLLARL